MPHKLRRRSFCWITTLASVAAPALGVAQQATPAVPDWAIPGSATHKQVPPPSGFHRPTRTEQTPIGIFTGVSEVGGALVTGSSSSDPKTGTYTIRSAWYGRDEFRFLLEKDVWRRFTGGRCGLSGTRAAQRPQGCAHYPAEP